ncbi:hypothetical protein N7462_004942 [Penicillium macrosclerotiorum]|uniref:uncharacterized protein n=1 Tax=Penicillium macrosclerotiorum TaxID=303699 RepID=UPI0025467F62|nr:uncharacterized protein N7462_004942 [Penicillium macrosclerotiorum]KAJ5690550.1 hypothetical protein N7462_004942 [Penicillium macrosclerotiorum]
MPHKHKRRERDESHFELPPSVIAKSLPVRDQQAKSKNGKKPQQQTNKKTQPGPAVSRRKGDLEDDTPKAFRRLMQYQTTGKRAPSGLETGEKKQDNKKRKRDPANDQNESSKRPTQAKPQQSESSTAEAKKEMPKILPGERLSDFAARVDRELPLSAMTKSQNPGAPKVREHKMTKHEKHLRRLQAGWREEEARIREHEQAEREERAAEMEDQLELWKEWEAEARGGKAKKKGTVPKKKAGNSGGTADTGDDDPDPWAKLKKRDKERQKNPFDFAQAPPELKKPREIFKVRGGARVDVANVPNAVGSLKRREDLAEERRNIVEEYRRLMAEKRGS